jgi:AbrB family looped-hinge helix DNA binding protein
MITGKARVSSKGWVVIPKEIRDEMGIQPGDEVSFYYWPSFVGSGEADGSLRLFPKRDTGSLLGKYKGKPGERSWTETLLEEKRRELEREERKIRAGNKRPRRRA